MPRRGRLIVAGCPLHVVQRGNNRTACFVADEDRRFYLLHLQRLLSRFDCALHAYCLMTNHVHLLLTPEGDKSCGLLMKNIGQLHSQYMNRKYGRTGALWEGRFRSSVVQSERYLLACYRYIELNPVRAELVSHPGEYEWSSYRANSHGMSNAMITPHADYLRLGGTDSDRCRTYTALVAEGLEETDLVHIRSAARGGQVLV